MSNMNPFSLENSQSQVQQQLLSSATERKNLDEVQAMKSPQLSGELEDEQLESVAGGWELRKFKKDFAFW